MISILCPTRGRPGNMRRLYESVIATAEYWETLQLVFYVDDDDEPSRAEAERLGADCLIGPRIVLSQMWNECYAQAEHDIVMQCGDDIIFRTPRWDAMVLDAFDEVPDNILLVHGRDGYQDAALATHGFYHRKWIDAVGYFMPPYFSSDYNDLWWTEVADAIGRRKYLDTFLTEHMHPVVGKGPLDLTHQERLVRHQQDNVQEIYKNKINERMRNIGDLTNAIAQFEG